MFRASKVILTCMLVIAMGHTSIVKNVAGDEETQLPDERPVTSMCDSCTKSFASVDDLVAHYDEQPQRKKTRRYLGICAVPSRRRGLSTSARTG